MTTFRKSEQVPECETSPSGNSGCFARRIATANTTFFIGLIALARCQELKQAGCSHRVGFVQSEFGLQVGCPAKKGIEVIFDYFGQRLIKLFCPLAKFPKGQRITIHLKARLVGNGRIPIVESKAAHGPTKCFLLVHIPGPRLGPKLTSANKPDGTKKPSPPPLSRNDLAPWQYSVSAAMSSFT